MESIPDYAALQRCLPGIQQAAKEVALRCILPWRLEQLKEAGFRGVIAFVEKNGHASELAPFERRAWSWIERAAATAGERLQASDGLSEPTNKQIREALETFSTDEWRALIREFDRRDVDVLRDYLDVNKEPLMRRLGRGKFNAIFAERMTRHFLLFFRQPIRETTTSDAMWAAYYYNEARCQNRACEPLPSIKRSGAETGGPNNIAEILSVRGGNPSPYKVRMMLRRMEQTPFEAFDGEPDEYFFWATDPKAYEHHLRLKKTAQRPSRDPDPFFITTN